MNLHGKGGNHFNKIGTSFEILIDVHNQKIIPNIQIQDEIDRFGYAIFFSDVMPISLKVTPPLVTTYFPKT